MDMPHAAESDALDYRAVVGLLELELEIPGCHSLKEKRGALARLLGHLRKKYPVSIAEVEHRNLWGRTGLAAVMVSGDRKVIDRTFNAAVEWLESSREVELIHFSIQML